MKNKNDEYDFTEALTMMSMLKNVENIHLPSKFWHKII